MSEEENIQPTQGDLKEQAIKNQYGISPIPAHTHNGTDSLRVDIKDISRFPPNPSDGDTIVYDTSMNQWVLQRAGQISFDNSKQMTSGDTYTNAGNLMFVGIFCQSNFTCSGVTFDGVSMALINSVAGANMSDSGAGTLYLFILKAPTIGTKTLTITVSGGTALAVVATYNNCSTVTQPDNSSTQSKTTTATFAESVTSTVSDCWAILVVAYVSGSGSNAGTNPTAGTNTVVRQQSNLRLSLADSAVAQNLGTITLNLNSPSQDYIGLMASFSPP